MEQLTASNVFAWLWAWVKATAFQWRKATLPTHANLANKAIYAIPDECCIGLAADWGSGTEPAMRVAEGLRSLEPLTTIHMGDVYFAG